MDIKRIISAIEDEDATII